MNTVGFSTTYDDDSDADDEYERSAVGSPVGIPPEFESSPTDSDPPSNEPTPTTFTHPIDEQNSAIGPPGIITEWTPDHCADFFSNLGLEEYAKAVVEEAIDGEALVAMQHNDLKDLGVASVGHRLTLLKAVYDLKLKQSVPIEPENYVPPSAEANAPDTNATQDDIARILHALKIRDERIMSAEAELRIMKEDLIRVVEENKRMREETLPLIRKMKDQNQPLPQPEEFGNDQPNSPHPSMYQDKSQPRLSRKVSNKKLYTGSQPTIHEVGNDLDPSAAAIAASSSLTSSMNGSNQASPTSPYLNNPIGARSFNRNEGSTASRVGQPQNDEQWPWSNHTTLTTNAQDPRASSNPPLSARRPPTTSSTTTLVDDPAGPVSAAVSSEKPSETFKSFRVSMDDPCHKVLPAALKKYKIEDDWRQYSLYIVYGDQERCLGWDERPLILFKQLYREEKKPMFMLRKHAAPAEGFTTTSTAATGARTSVGGRAGGVQFPGGVF